MKTKNCLKTLKILQTIGIVFIPSVISIASCQLQKNALEQKYIETAVEILKEKPTAETQGIRSWAITVFTEYSPIKIDKIMENELRTEALPAKVISMNPDGTAMLNPDNSVTAPPSKKQGKIR